MENEIILAIAFIQMAIKFNSHSNLIFHRRLK